nr:glycosyltransferase family 39 protein [Gemmatimonadaceae bacterium]
MSDGGGANHDAQSLPATLPAKAKHGQSPAAASGDWARFSTAGLIFGLSVLALLIRVSLAKQSGLWRDEGLFLFVARVDTWAAMLEFLRFNESHPPLFYAVMRAWMSIAGSSDAAAQVIPVMLGVALVPAIYSAGASLFSRRAGLLAATLAALSPALAEHAAVVRPYSLLPLLALLSSYTLVRGFQHGGRRVWLTHTVSTLAILYTHNWGILVLGGQWVAAVCVLMLKSTRPGTALVRQWIVSQLMIAVGYAPWISTLLYQSRHAGHAPPSIDGLAEYLEFVAEGLRLFLQATLVGYMPVDDRAILAVATRTVVVLLFTFAAIALVFWSFARGRAPRMASSQLSPSQLAPDGRELYGLPLIILVAVPVSAWLAALVLSPRSNLLLTRCMVTLAPMFILSFSVWLTRRRTGLLAGGLIAAAAMLVATYCASLVALSRGSRSNARE